ncbi:hypothetical protein GOP47_0004291, partial [Adiantum capillus-veneris]
ELTKDEEIVLRTARDHCIFVDVVKTAQRESLLSRSCIAYWGFVRLKSFPQGCRNSDVANLWTDLDERNTVDSTNGHQIKSCQQALQFGYQSM